MTSVSPYLVIHAALSVNYADRYQPSMVQSCGVSIQHVSIWAGIISATFSVFQCISALPWARFSNTIGRKPAILIGTACLSLSVAAFGLSTSLRQIIISRALAGVANGDFGVTSTIIAELVPEKDLQPAAFTILSLNWTLGRILGPALGGLLTAPSINDFIIEAGWSFPRKYRWFLPNIVISTMLLFGMILGFFFIPSTLPVGKRVDSTGHNYELLQNNDLNDNSEALEMWSLNTQGDCLEEGIALQSPEYPVWTRQSVLNLIAVFCLCIHSMCYDQLLPVFMHYPRLKEAPESFLSLYFVGGFDMESFSIGFFFAMSGIVSMVAQILLYPKLANTYGVHFCMKLSAVTFILAYILIPFTGLTRERYIGQIYLLVLMVFKSIAAVFAFPSLAIMLARCTEDTSTLATLNGLSTSFSALGDALGPLLGGLVFTWGVSNGSIVFPWWMLTLVATMGAVPVFLSTQGQNGKKG